MRVLTYTSYKGHCDLYTEIHGSITVNSCQTKFRQKDIILLSSVSIRLVNEQRQDWEPRQIKDLRLMIPKDYTSMVFNTIFIALGIQDNYLEITTLIRSTLPPGLYKTSLDASPPPKSLSLHPKQINKVKNELDGQPSS